MKKANESHGTSRAAHQCSLKEMPPNVNDESEGLSFNILIRHAYAQL